MKRILALSLCLLSPQEARSGQERSAEEIFQSIKDRIVGAREFRFRSTATVVSKDQEFCTVNVVAQLQKGNKLHYECKVTRRNTASEEWTIRVVSDGSKLLLESLPGHSRGNYDEVPPTLFLDQAMTMAYLGIPGGYLLQGEPFVTPLKSSGNSVTAFVLTKGSTTGSEGLICLEPFAFQSSQDEKGNKFIKYRLRRPHGKEVCEVKLWYDPATLQPLRRWARPVLQEAFVTEQYHEFIENPETPTEHFALPANH